MPKKQKRVLLALGWYDYRLHQGIEKYAQEHGWHLYADLAREKVIPWGWEGDGILAWLGAGDDLAEFVQSTRKPTVDFSLRRPQLKFPRVLEDHAHAAELVAEHFLARGFGNFMFYSDASNWSYEERGAGFVWWDTSPSKNSNPPPLPGSTSPSFPTAPINSVAGINGAKGDYDPDDFTPPNKWPSSPSDTTAPSTASVPIANSNYAARPASSHPGGVIVAFAGGNTRFVRDDIDYPVYCLLMTPNGAHATTMSYTMPAAFTTVTFPPAQSWQKFSPVSEDSF